MARHIYLKPTASVSPSVSLRLIAFVPPAWLGDAGPGHSIERSRSIRTHQHREFRSCTVRQPRAIATRLGRAHRPVWQNVLREPQQPHHSVGPTYFVSTCPSSFSSSLPASPRLLLLLCVCVGSAVGDSETLSVDSYCRQFTSLLLCPLNYVPCCMHDDCQVLLTASQLILACKQSHARSCVIISFSNFFYEDCVKFPG